MKASGLFRILDFLCVIGLIAWAFASPARGRAAEPTPRVILALYDGAAESRTDCRIRRWAETPLNHLGYVLDYRDIRDAPPAPDRLDRYAAILTWFAGPVEAPERYLRWAADAARRGAKYIIFGETGGRLPGDLFLVNSLLEPLGLRASGRRVDVAFGTLVAKTPPTFEAAADPAPPPYPVITPTRPDVRALVELAPPAREGGGGAAAAMVGERGGFVASGFEMRVEPGLNRARWLIDPFFFFRSILDARNWPRPDVTTLSGRRALLALIDIDPPDAMTRARDASPLAALHDMIARHPDSLLTLSFDPQDFPPGIRAAESGRDLLLDLLRRPGIDGAFRPDLCEAAKGFARKTCFSLADFAHDGAAPLAGFAEARDRIGLIQLVSNEIAPEAAARTGLAPIQEAFSRLSASYPSIAHVAPLSRTGAGATVALLPGDPWSPGARQGMQDVLDMETTAENAERPRRLAPLFWRARTNALVDPDISDRIERQLARVEDPELIPVAVRDYAAMVRDFAQCEIAALGPNLWRVSKLGSVKTFRVDGAGMELDLSRSVGALGARRQGDALYIAIDAARDEALIALRDAAAPAAPIVGLRDSRWTVSHLERDRCGWRFVAAGAGPADFTWYSAAPGGYEVTATAADGAIWRGSARADARRLLTFRAALASRAPVRFAVRCAPLSAAR